MNPWDHGHSGVVEYKAQGPSGEAAHEPRALPEPWDMGPLGPHRASAHRAICHMPYAICAYVPMCLCAMCYVPMFYVLCLCVCVPDGPMDRWSDGGPMPYALCAYAVCGMWALRTSAKTDVRTGVETLPRPTHISIRTTRILYYMKLHCSRLFHS